MKGRNKFKNAKSVSQVNNKERSPKLCKARLTQNALSEKEKRILEHRERVERGE